ncbi:MAG: DUF2079 domain-containing protein, partial [bacterium]
MKPKNKAYKKIRQQPLILSFIIVLTSSLVFSYFLFKTNSLKLFFSLFVLPFFFLLWIGFSFLLSHLSKERLKDSLLKDAKTFIPFFFLLLVYLKDKIGLYNPNIWFAFLFIIVISATIFLKVRILDWNAIRKRFPAKSSIIPLSCLIISILLYTFIFTFLSFLRHDRLLSGMDLAGFNQAIWNTLSGKILHTTIYGHNFLGCHMSPALILIAPIYALWQDPKMLLFLQTLFLALGALPIYLIAYHKLKDRFISLVFAFAYLLHPFLSRINLVDFHEISMAPPLLLFCFYFLIKERFSLYFVFLILSLTTKEDVSFAVCALGIYAFFKENKKIGIATFMIGLFWMFFAIKIAIPSIGKVTLQTHQTETEWKAFYSQRYIHLGKNPSEWIETILKHPLPVLKTIIIPKKIVTIILLLLPFGFFSLLSPIILIALPNLLLHLLGHFKLQHLLLWHNSAVILPFVALSAICGFSNLSEKFKGKLKIPLSLFLLSISFLSNLHFSSSIFQESSDSENYKPHKSLLFIPKATKEENTRIPLFYLLKNLFPKDASISTGDPFAPHLSGRKEIFRFNEAVGDFEKADYVVLDLSRRTLVFDLLLSHLKKLEQDKRFFKIFEEEKDNGFVIWVRRGKEKELISSVLRLKPNSHSHFILSSIYFHLGRKEEAQKEGEKAIELSPDYPFKEAW